MKKLIVFALIGILFYSCKTEPQRTDYIINGNAKGVYNGVRAYLKTKVDNGREKVIDTAIIFNEAFTFNGESPTPTHALITVNSVTGQLNFMLENSVIDITVNKSNIKESKVSGSTSQKDFETYQNGITALNKKTLDTKSQLRNNRSLRQQSEIDSLTTALNSLEKEKQEFPLRFINENPDSYYNLSVIDQETNKNNANIEDYLSAFENLDSNIKESAVGIKVKTKLDNLIDAYKKTAQLQIGKIAPNFEAPTPDGNLVSLNDLKGKVTIIDFWAAWCGPCRRENPNVVRVYNKFHDQGLEIIGVSLDGARTQKDPKKSWLDAVEKDRLTWNQVSNLQYFNDPVAKLYNIKSIPATYILDSEGKIVAKNLRGIDLERKVEELLGK